MPLGIKQYLQVPTSTVPEKGSATSHVNLIFYSDSNSIVGAYHYLVPTGVGNKAWQHTYPHPLTCKAIPFIYKRGCTSSNKGPRTDSS